MKIKITIIDTTFNISKAAKMANPAFFTLQILNVVVTTGLKLFSFFVCFKLQFYTKDSTIAMKGVNVCSITRSVQVLLTQPNRTLVSNPVKLMHHLAQQQPALSTQKKHQQQVLLQTRTACGTALCSGKCKKAARRQREAVSGGNLASRANHKHTGNVAQAVQEEDGWPVVSQHDADQVLEVRLDESQVARLPYVWLRDHCRSSRYFNQNTQQKIPDLQLLDRDLTPQSVYADNKGLSIKCKP